MVGGNPPGFQGEDQGISTGTSGDKASDSMWDLSKDLFRPKN